MRKWLLCLLLIIPGSLRAPVIFSECQLQARKAQFEMEAAQWATEYSIDSTLSRTILRRAHDNHIDTHVAYKLIWKESGFDSAARGTAGEIGLTQLMPGTAKQVRPDLSERELWTADTNISVGFEHFRWLLDRYHNNYRLALTAYNRGTVRADWLYRYRLCAPLGYVDAILGPRGSCARQRRSYT